MNLKTYFNFSLLYSLTFTRMLLLAAVVGGKMLHDVVEERVQGYGMEMREMECSLPSLSASQELW
jgi:hypothetical protein